MTGGYLERVCGSCGYVEIPEADKVPPRSHRYSLVTSSTRCTGTIRVYECNYCGFMNTEEDKTTVGKHTFGTYQIDKQATCSHEGSKSKHCMKCGAISDSQVIAKTNNHSFSNWTILKAATTTDKGVEVRSCKDCNFTEEKDLAKLPSSTDSTTPTTKPDTQPDQKPTQKPDNTTKPNPTPTPSPSNPGSGGGGATPSVPSTPGVVPPTDSSEPTTPAPEDKPSADKDTTKVIKVTGVSINHTSATVEVGKSYMLEASVKPADATNPAVTWKSDKTSIATVSSTGIITAKKEGTATITVTTKDGNKKATAKITVAKKGSVKAVKVTGVKLDKKAASINSGSKIKLTATVSPENATNNVVIFKSSKAVVASVAQDGTVTAKSAGTTTITATTKDGNKKATCTVTVKASKDVKVTKVTVTKSTLFLKKGEEYKIQAKVTPANATNKTLTYSSNKKTVATVDKNGVIKAVGTGTATITVSNAHSGKKATIKVTVK